MSFGMKINESRRREYRQKGYWGDATLEDYWNLSVLRSPEKIAIVDEQGTKFTYKELNEAAEKLASFLRERKIKKGDIVSVQLPGWSEFAIILIACLKVGAVINPILPNLRQRELYYILNKCETKVIFIPYRYRNFEYLSMINSLTEEILSLREVIIVDKENELETYTEKTLEWILNHSLPTQSKNETGGDDLAAILFTSGTEGHPKGVMLTHNNIIASEKVYAKTFNLTYLDCILMPAPIAHATGFHHGLTTAFLVGAKCVLQDIFKPEITLRLIEREKCTCANGPTSYVYDLIQTLEKTIGTNKYDISSLRFFLCGGSPVPRHIIKRAMELGIKLISVYGSTESVPHMAPRLDDPIEKIINTDGRPMDGIEVKIVDEFRKPVSQGNQGEEVSRGPNVFVGYLKEPELTDRVLDDEGWFYSGDLCKMDEDGYITITGRKKDIIIRGGENISSNEIESILLQHPNIKEAAVVGMPDKRLGERTCAYVVLKDFNKGLTLREVVSFFEKKKVAKYKYPERLEICNSLPHTSSNKIKKYILRERIMKELNNV